MFGDEFIFPVLSHPEPLRGSRVGNLHFLLGSKTLSVLSTGEPETPPFLFT